MQRYLYALATDRYKGFIPCLFKFFLLPLSFVYGLAVKMLVFFSQLSAVKLDARVISVGNITVGGTGKTTLVEFIARHLKQKGHKVAILTRGYKRKLRAYSSGFRAYEEMGDEPYMLQCKLKDVPVVVDPDRVRSGKRAIREHSIDTLILDDGFQQWRLKKDLEIVTIDAVNPFGNRYLLPRGILREGFSSLRRADMFLLSKTNLNPDTAAIKHFLRSVNPSAEIIESIHKPSGFYQIDRPLELSSPAALRGVTASLFCGIGDPESFENLVASLGVNIGSSFSFCDHYAYCLKDLENIIKDAKEKGISTIITTEKDAARLKELNLSGLKERILVLRIELEIKDEERFFDRLLKLYSI